MQVDAVNHLPLGTPCLQPEGLETSSPYLSLGNGDNGSNGFDAITKHLKMGFSLQLLMLKLKLMKVNYK